VRKLHILSLIALALASPSTPFTSQAHGQAQELGFSINPAIIDIGAEGQSSSQHTFTIQSTSPDPIPVIVEAKSLLPIDTILDQSRRSEFDASSWISIDENSFILEPNKPQVVTFTLEVPKNANPGGHYATINITPLNVQNAAAPNESTKIIPQIGTTVLITVPGNVIERAELDTANLLPERITKGKQTSLSFKVRNTGNVHLLVGPKLSIYKGDTLVEVFTLQPQLILPNTEKTFSEDWMANESYGSYTARAELIYGTSSVPLSSPPYAFSILPPLLEIGLSVFLGLIILFVLINIRKVPKAIDALKGRVHQAPKRFKAFAGVSEIKRPHGELTPPDEVAKALSEESILGLPDFPKVEVMDWDEEDENEAQTYPNKKAEPNEKPHRDILSTTVVQNNNTVTRIVQTSSSTIVREQKSPEEVTSTSQEPRKITVLDANENQQPKKKSKNVAAKKTAKAKTTKKAIKNTSTSKSKKAATAKKSTAKDTK
jgi:hypothetical protein